MEPIVFTYINKRQTVSTLIAKEDGELVVIGDDWKQCPKILGKPCPRGKLEDQPDYPDRSNKKCKTCTYYGSGHFKDQEQAVSVAKLIINKK